jgi:hypothetical protein
MTARSISFPCSSQVAAECPGRHHASRRSRYAPPTRGSTPRRRDGGPSCTSGSLDRAVQTRAELGHLAEVDEPPRLARHRRQLLRRRRKRRDPPIGFMVKTTPSRLAPARGSAGSRSRARWHSMREGPDAYGQQQREHARRGHPLVHQRAHRAFDLALVHLEERAAQEADERVQHQQRPVIRWMRFPAADSQMPTPSATTSGVYRASSTCMGGRMRAPSTTSSLTPARRGCAQDRTGGRRAECAQMLAGSVRAFALVVGNTASRHGGGSASIPGGRCRCCYKSSH